MVDVDLVSRVIKPYNSQRRVLNGTKNWQNFLLGSLCTVVLLFSRNQILKTIQWHIYYLGKR